MAKLNYSKVRIEKLTARAKRQDGLKELGRIRKIYSRLKKKRS